jgi:hypothetical protein
MARKSARNLNISLNAVAIEDSVNSVTTTFTNGEAEITAFSDAWQNFLAGKTDVVTTIDGTYDTSTDGTDAPETLWDAQQSGGKALVIDPTGSGPDTDLPEYQVASSGLTGALVTAITCSFPVGDTATYSATIQHSGATTRALS